MSDNGWLQMIAANPGHSAWYIERFRSIEMESGGTTFRTTCSIGVAARESDQDTVEAMLSRADEALYRAKRTGRDRVEAGPGRPMAR